MRAAFEAVIPRTYSMEPNVPTEASHSRESSIASSLLDGFLEGVATTMGKLVWLATFRVPGSDEYRHPAMDQVVPHTVASQALRERHDCIFGAWLGMDLEEQHKDLAEYLHLHTTTDDLDELLRANLDHLIPVSAQRPQRMLFETDLDVVLELAGK